VQQPATPGASGLVFDQEGAGAVGVHQGVAIRSHEKQPGPNGTHTHRGKSSSPAKPDSMGDWVMNWTAKKLALNFQGSPILADRRKMSSKKVPKWVNIAYIKVIKVLSIFRKSPPFLKGD